MSNVFSTISQALGDEILGKIFASKVFDESLDLKRNVGTSGLGNLFVAIVGDQRKGRAIAFQADCVGESLNK
tara:strand:- start:167 stop:382 length:216 start_codon:yes stop_codon:yes gene_type:complete